MKKVVRSVWICALSGLAFMGACCSQNGLSRKERKQLTKERDEVRMKLEMNRSFEVEGPFPDYMDHKSVIYALENKLDSINYRLGENIDLDRNVRRRQILQRIDSLTFLIENYTPACIYGSPEMMQSGAGRIDREYEQMESALRKARREQEEMDRVKKIPDAEALYGSPVVKQKK